MALWAARCVRSNGLCRAGAAAGPRLASGTARRGSPVVAERALRRVFCSSSGAAFFPPAERTAEEVAGERITWIGAASNVVLSASKFGAGYVSGSTALVADAVHSLSDLVSDAVTLGALRFSRWPADATQPYGYGRYDTIGTLAVGVMISGAGGSIVLNAVHTFQLAWIGGAAPIEAIPLALGCLFVSCAVKEALYHFTESAGRAANSQVLMANAWHHRSDALSSLVALGGVGGYALGIPHCELFDPVASFVVGGLVAKVGVEIGREAVNDLADCADPDFLFSVKSVALTVPDVVDCQAVRARRCGPYMLVDLEAVVHPRLSVTAAHHAAAVVRRAVLASQSMIREVDVRVVPAYVPPRLPEVTNREVDAELRAIAQRAAPSSLVLSVSSVMHHFLEPEKNPAGRGPAPASGRHGVTAEVAIVLRPGRSLKEAGEATRVLQEALEASTVGDARVPVVRAIVRIDASAGGRALP